MQFVIAQEPQLKISTGHSDYVEFATYSPDGKTILTTSADNTAKLWDSRTGQLLHTFIGHTKWVSFACYSPNGKTIITKSDDYTMKLWSTQTGLLLQDIDVSYQSSDFLALIFLYHFLIRQKIIERTRRYYTF
jgi:WD40 repeat protein